MGFRSPATCLAHKSGDFELSQKRTSLNGPYTRTSHNVYYVKCHIYWEKHLRPTARSNFRYIIQSVKVLC
jgi:hypothetical protein